MNRTRPARISMVLVVLSLSVFTAACELVADIFQAGMAVGAIVVVLVLVAIVWIVAKLRR